MTIDLEERDTWRKFAPTHPIADPQSELVDGFLAFLVNQNLADIYSKSGHLLLLRANSPWQVPVTKSSMSVGSEINTATLDLEEKEVKEFLRLLQEKNPSGVLRLSKRDGCEMSSCDAQWLEYDVPWMWALLEKIDHGFAAAGMAAARIFHKLVEMDVLKVLPDDQDVYTLVGPRKALELHSRIGTEYLYTDLYDTLELNAIFDYEDWPSMSTMPDTLLDRAQAKKIKNRAIEALDKVAFLLVTRATGTGVRVQGSQAIKIQTGTDISLMSAEDFRMNIFHPMIVENMGLNMFSKAIAEVKAITLEVGQNTGTTSVLVINRFKSRPVVDWEANDERLKNWDPLTATLDKIEKPPGAEDGVQTATARSGDDDMRENTDKRTRGTTDDGQEGVTSADAEGREEGATATSSKKKKGKKGKSE
jgi:hypothetical protein